MVLRMVDSKTPSRYAASKLVPTANNDTAQSQSDADRQKVRQGDVVAFEPQVECAGKHHDENDGKGTGGHEFLSVAQFVSGQQNSAYSTNRRRLGGGSDACEY